MVIWIVTSCSDGAG